MRRSPRSETYFLFLLTPFLTLTPPMLTAASAGGGWWSVTGDTTASLRPDSVASRDTSMIAAEDSAQRIGVGPRSGDIEPGLDSSLAFTADRLQWRDRRSTGDLLSQMPGIVLRDQFSAGQYSQPVVRGADWRSIAVLQNGRLLNDPATGTYNLYQPSVEYLDHLEVVTGPRAFLYGLNGAGASVNLVTKEYSARRPFSKINYIQSAYDYQYTDGTFSQNFARTLNMTLGFQQQSTQGRFGNSYHQMWNGRAKFRYTPSRDFSVQISDYFTSTRTDLNGGLDPSALASISGSIPAGAAVVNSDSYEKVRRHDADLTAAATLLGDSTSVSSASVYYSWNLREYRDEENRFPSNGVFIQSDHTSSWAGIRLSQTIDASWQRFSAAGTVEIRQIEGSPNLGRHRDVVGSAWAREEILFRRGTTVGIYARYDSYLGKSYGGYGADVSLPVLSFLTLFGGASSSRRLPNYAELYWTDSTVSRPASIAAETHTLIEAGGTFTFGSTGTVRIAGFVREVADPIVMTSAQRTSIFPAFSIANESSLRSTGLETSVSLRFWKLTLEGTGTWITQRQNNSQTLELLPRMSTTGGLYFWDILFGGHLELKTGLRGRFQTSSIGERFNPEALTYVANTSEVLEAGGSVDFFLIGHIGDAYVHIMWENLTDAQFFATPYYPVLDRALRFGILWEFLD